MFKRILQISTIILGLQLLTIKTSLASKHEVSGYYITLKGDTVKCTLLIPHTFFGGNIKEESLEYRIRYLDSNGKVQKLKPKEIKEYGFRSEGENIIMRSVYNTLFLGSIFNINRFLFMKLKLDGNLCYLEFTFSRNSGGGYYGGYGAGFGGGFGAPIYSPGFNYKVNRKILLKKNGDMIRVPQFGFKGDMKKFLKECPEVVDRIDANVFDAASTYDMVKLYNDICK